jgi:hypothetical protein
MTDKREEEKSGYKIEQKSVTLSGPHQKMIVY